MKRLSIFLSIFLFLAAAVSGQRPSDYGIKSKKALKLFFAGNEQEKYRDYDTAIEYYGQALEIESEFGEALFRKGACHYVRQRYEQAEADMERARAILSDPNPLLHFYLGECKFYREDFEGALASYKDFQNSRGTRSIPRTMLRDADRHQASAEFAVKMSGQTIEFNPINLGENINTAFDEYLPYLTADEQTIFFTTRRPGCTGGYNAEYRGYTEDFYFSVLKDGEWQPAENLGAPVNTEFNEGAASFSPDGQYVFFTACKRRDGYGDCDIYVSRLNGKTWEKPKNLGPIINTPAWESQPSISNDGRTLYFTSSRNGGEGGQDIWYSTKEGKKWTEPKNIGKTLNTKGNEMSPFMHADGKTLYFASDGHLGYGALDLFMTKKTEDGWTEPVNLGYPLNTSANEGNIFINSKGNIGYINSTREGGLGRGDMYSFELDPKIRPEFMTYVRGHVREKGTGKALRSKVTFINVESGDTLREVYSNKATGKFLLTLPLEQEYAAFVDRPGYLFASQHFSLKGLGVAEDADRYFDVDIDLDRLEVGVKVVMRSIFYETNKFDLLDKSKAELEHLLRFLQVNPKVKIEIGGHTDNVGSESDNQRLSENRAGEVKKFMVSRGISGDRIVAKGYGEKEPLADNGEEQGRAFNRRTEMRIIGME